MIFNNIGIMWVQLSELSIEDKLKVSSHTEK